MFLGKKLCEVEKKKKNVNERNGPRERERERTLKNTVLCLSQSEKLYVN